MPNDTLTCGFVLVGLFLLLPIVLSIMAYARTRRILDELEQLRDRNQKLTHQMAELRNSLASGAVASPPRAAPPPAAKVVPAMPPKEFDALPVVHPSPTPVPSLARLVEQKMKTPDVAAAAMPPAVAKAVAPQPVFIRETPPPPAPKPAEPAKPGPSLEEIVGQKILPWLGVTIVVVGMALFLWYAYTRLDAKQRLLLAGGTGAAMVVGGIFLGRREKFGLLGGCLTAGGWAVLYGTAFAAHFVKTSQIIESPTIGFIVLMAVGVAAVLHALRHNSEWVVAMAYALIFLTLFLSPQQGISAWLAMGIPAGGLVLLAWRRRWIKLCTLGAAVLYIAEAFWLTSSTPDALVETSVLLVGLWILFQLPDFFHRPADQVDELFHGTLVLINFVGVLVIGYLIHGWFHTKPTGTVRLVLGLIYASKGVIGRRHEWRFAYLADLTFALVLLGAGAEEKLEGPWPSLAWTGLSLLLFVYGIVVKENYFRLLADLGLLVTQLRLWIADKDGEKAILGLVYAAKGVLARGREEQVSYRADLTFAFLLLGAAAHEKFAGIWPSMTWMGLSALLFAYGAMTGESYFRLLAGAGLLATQGRTWLYDRRGETFHIGAWAVDKILVPALTGAGLLYGYAAASARLARGAVKSEADPVVIGAALHIGGFFLALSLWYFPPEISVAVLFAVVGILFIELGRWRQLPSLVHQGLHFAVIAAFFVSIYNLEASGLVVGISRRVASTLPVLAVWMYLRETAQVGHGEVDFSDKARRFFAILGFAGLLALLRFELGASGTPLAWAVASTAWMAWGLVSGRGVEFMLGSTGAALSTLMLAATRNPAVPLTRITGSIPTGVPMIALFLAAHVACRLKTGFGSDRGRRLLRDMLAVSMSSATFILLEQVCTGTWLTGSWALLGFTLAGYGFAMKDRTSRWLGLIVLGICLAKVALFDLATFSMEVKIATLLTLGGVMIALSYVYVRFNRVVKEFLIAD